jgi:hypothetical protein
MERNTREIPVAWNHDDEADVPRDPSLHSMTATLEKTHHPE